MIKKFLVDFPTTSGIVVTGIVLAIMTAIRYQLNGAAIGPLTFAQWEPSESWLLFVLTVMGVGTTHFGIKRTTDKEYQAVKNGAPAPTVVTDNANVSAQGDVNVVSQDPPTEPLTRDD